MDHVEYDELSYSKNNEIISQNDLINLQKKLNKKNGYYT